MYCHCTAVGVDDGVGDGTTPMSAYVNFYIDGVYLGTNNAYVPTRGSRFWLAMVPDYGKYVPLMVVWSSMPA